MNTTGKIMTAFAAGAAAGAVIGLLFAPDKGSETRRKLNEEGRKLMRLKDKMAKKEGPSFMKEDKEIVNKEDLELAL